MQKHRLYLILISTFVILLAVVFIASLVITKIIYDSNFKKRHQSSSRVIYRVEYYDGLNMEECSFRSNKGQVLAGAKYSRDDQEIKGLAVLAHGFGGGGQRTFMEVSDFLTRNGYLVFAYDATANDKSEGDGIAGLPQGVIDLDYALKYAKSLPEYKNLPIVLFGHSWGAYSVGSVLEFHPDVKAAVMASGLHDSPGMIRQRGKEYAGDAVRFLMPSARFYEWLMFGKYASCSASEGFQNAPDTRVMIIYSMDDQTVLPECGYEPFIPYMDSARFQFRIYEDRGHDPLHQKQHFASSSSGLDQELFADIVAFYDSSIK